MSLNVDTETAWHTSCVHIMYNNILVCTVYTAKAEWHTFCVHSVHTPARQNGTQGNSFIATKLYSGAQQGWQVRSI